MCLVADQAETCLTEFWKLIFSFWKMSESTPNFLNNYRSAYRICSSVHHHSIHSSSPKRLKMRNIFIKFGIQNVSKSDSHTNGNILWTSVVKLHWWQHISSNKSRTFWFCCSVQLTGKSKSKIKKQRLYLSYLGQLLVDLSWPVVIGWHWKPLWSPYFSSTKLDQHFAAGFWFHVPSSTAVPTVRTAVEDGLWHHSLIGTLGRF